MRETLLGGLLVLGGAGLITVINGCSIVIRRNGILLGKVVLLGLGVRGLLRL